ncbi:MAG: hypothetical protein ACRDBX_04175, partial [Erysipelotrichaceae bacterium]
QPYEVYIQKDVMHLYKVNLSSGIVFLSIGFSGLNLEGPPLLSFLIVGSLIAVLVNENLT